MNRTSNIPAFIISRMIQLLDKGGWCQHVMAKDAEGNPCYVEDKGATYFNLVGAFYWVRDKFPQTVKHQEDAIADILSALNKRNTAEGLIKSPSDLIKDAAAKNDAWKGHFNKFNDAPGRTKMEVVRLLREAMDDA